jgi:bifunctional DNase/RNase
MTCDVVDCEENGTFYVTLAERGTRVGSRVVCKRHQRDSLDSWNDSGTLEPSEVNDYDEKDIPFDLRIVAYDEQVNTSWVYLREINGSRFVIIEVGPFEASAINWQLSGTKNPRPLTHEAFVNAIRLMGGTMRQVIVDYYQDKDHTFHAKVEINTRDGDRVLDVRPSDALLLALVAEVPVLVAQTVLLNCTWHR